MLSVFMLPCYKSLKALPCLFYFFGYVVRCSHFSVNDLGG